MLKGIVYDLTFETAIKAVLHDGCWVQGELFGDGIILKLQHDVVVIYNFENRETVDFFISANTINQKFRKIYMRQDAMRVRNKGVK